MQINEKNYVDKAEAAITRLSKMVNRQGKVIPMVTTSKIRNLLAMAADIIIRHWIAKKMYYQMN